MLIFMYPGIELLQLDVRMRISYSIFILAVQND